MKTLTIIALAFGLTGCSTLSFDKEHATEHRKQELCRDISTRELPQCTGSNPRQP